MRLKFDDWSDESYYTWEIVHDDTHFEPHARPTYRTFEEWARHYEPIRTANGWEVHFIMPRSIEQIEVNYTINSMDGITVNNAINQVGG